MSTQPAEPGNLEEMTFEEALRELEQIVARQTEAISNLKIDKVTVWDSGNGDSGKVAVSAMSAAYPTSCSRAMSADINQQQATATRPELVAALGRHAREANAPGRGQ